MLVDRGLLDYDQRVSHYWPQFGQNGKQNVTVRDLVQHTAGLTWFDEPIPFELLDPSRLDDLSEFLAKARHVYNGVRISAYSTMHSGPFINELVRRVDPKHRTIAEFTQDEITVPLGVEFYYGLPIEYENRFSPMIHLNTIQLTMHLLRVYIDIPNLKKLSDEDKSSWRNMLWPNSAAMNASNIIANMPKNFFDIREFREIQSLVTGNGVSNAASLAKIAQVMALNGTFDVKLMSSETAIHANTYDSSKCDHFFMRNFTRTLGGFTKMLPDADFIGWAGGGGSLIVWEPARQLSFAYVPKSWGVGITIDSRAEHLLRTVMRLYNYSAQYTGK
jgi:CubicO group peptidase (beta-lactamase class C family)